MFRLMFVLFLLSPFTSHAQVNIENQRSGKKGFLTTVTVGSQLKKGNSDVFDLKSSLRLDHNTQHNHFFILTDYEYGQSNGEDYKGSKFYHVRNTYRFLRGLEGVLHKSNLGVEGFTQYQSNVFSDLELRQLLGFGLRYEEVDERGVKVSARDVYAFGLAGMLEYESLISGEEGGISLRMTSYISFRKTTEGKNAFFLVAYFQPKVLNLKDFRVLSECGVEFKLSRNAFIRNALRFNYDSRPPTEIEKYDLSNLVSLKLDW